VTHGVSFHPAALAEVEDAEAWYVAERVELGDAFIADLEATASRVAGNPLAFAERFPRSSSGPTPPVSVPAGVPPAR